MSRSNGNTAFELEDEMEDFEDLEDFEVLEDFEEEGDPFLGKALRMGREALGGPLGSVLGGMSPKALARQATSALGSALGAPQLANAIAGQVFREGMYEDESEAELEGDFEAMGGDQQVLNRMHYYVARAADASSSRESDQFFGAIANLAGPLISSLLGESEGELEDFEDFEDLEDFEDEADPFLPALLPFAAKALPIAAKVLPHALPFVKRGIRALGRFFRESEAEQAAVAIPTIVARTATEIAKRTQAGKPVARKHVVAAMARQTAKTLGNKQTLAAAIKQNRAAVRRIPARR